jgi:hypothetical protein
LQAAFAEAIVKVSANPNEMMVPMIKAASTNPTQWIDSYAYFEKQNANPQAAPDLFLQVAFDRVGLQQLLSETQPAVKVPLAQSTVMMVVSGVKNIADYRQLMQVLRDKNDVANVSVNNVQGDQVLLEIKIIGDSAQLQQVLASDNHFQSMVNGVGSTQLQYNWMGNQA